MMQFYPDNAAEVLEFDKVAALLIAKCRTDLAREQAENIRFHTHIDHAARELNQTMEFKTIQESGDHFPNDFTRNLQKELKLLTLENAVLNGEQFIAIKQLALCIKDILQWFSRNPGLFPHLQTISEKTTYEKNIAASINAIIDDKGIVRDDASPTLANIRRNLVVTRQAARRAFDGMVRKLAKLGYLADTTESFINSRRTIAVLAEYKRIVRGILHGESDTHKTAYLEPEETIDLNNEIFSLEREEGREIHRILAQATRELSVYAPLLEGYYQLCGIYDYIRAKAQLAVDMNASMPILNHKPGIHLVNARHPLLYLHHKTTGKPTIPQTLTLDNKNWLLIISGPNAGGKTVAMKTAGLLQMMAQAGMLIPADPQTELGFFKQLFVQIGDTQSIERELSTYSAHLRDMKYFMDFATGRTLFFIDELGSGSDPTLGGAFAEAILEFMAGKHAFGIVTTHYLNLKIMAGKVPGIMNGAMTFDEANLEPLYKLVTGKPGSSYTFAIAQRSGLPTKVIERARQLTQSEHFKLDKLLLQTEQLSLNLAEKEKQLDSLIKENHKLKQNYEVLTDKEKLKQQTHTLRLQNTIKKEELDYLRDTERKFKQIIQDWKKTENKQEVIEAAENVLFKRKQLQTNYAAAKKADKNYETVGTAPKVGDLVRNTQNHQIGTLTEFRDKRAIVKIGNLPFNVNPDDWVVVKRKREE